MKSKNIVSIVQVAGELGSMSSRNVTLLLHVYRHCVQEGANLVIASAGLKDASSSQEEMVPFLLKEISEYMKLGTPLLLATPSRELSAMEARGLTDYRTESRMTPYLLEKNRVTVLPEAEPITLLQQRMNIIIGDEESVCEDALDLTIRFSTTPWYKGNIAAQLDSRCWEARMQRSSVIYVAPLNQKDEDVYPGGSCLIDATGRIVSRLPYFSESYTLLKI